MLVSVGTHSLQLSGAAHFLPIFWSLMPTEAGDTMTRSIDCAIPLLEKFLGVRMVARVGIIDRSIALENGIMNSSVYGEYLKLIITCFEHLLFAGKCPGSKAVQDVIQVLLKQLHKCTSENMVRAVFALEIQQYQDVPEYTDAINWLSNVIEKWDFFVTSAGVPGIMPSAQCVESFNRVLKIVAPRLNVKLSVFMHVTVPEILKLCADQFTENIVRTFLPFGIEHVVRLFISALSPWCLWSVFLTAPTHRKLKFSMKPSNLPLMVTILSVSPPNRPLQST